MRMSIEEWLDIVSKREDNICYGIHCDECPFSGNECPHPLTESPRIYKKYTKITLIEEILR